MKSFLCLGSLLAATVLFSACATTSSTPVRGTTAAFPEHAPRLQLTVDVPPSMNLLIQEDVSEAFAYRVMSTLHEQGFRGRIRYVERGETPIAGVPVLAVTLREWRVDGLGNVDCIFTAAVESPNGNRNLGVFSGTAMMTWSRRNWMDRQRDFEEAARDALSNLEQRIVETRLLTDSPMR
jgi:hypothetical protein